MTQCSTIDLPGIVGLPRAARSGTMAELPLMSVPPVAAANGPAQPPAEPPPGGVGRDMGPALPPARASASDTCALVTAVLVPPSDGASLAAGAAAFEDVVLKMEGGGSITIPAEEVGFILGKHSVNATKGTFFGMLRDKLRIRGLETSADLKDALLRLWRQKDPGSGKPLLINPTDSFRSINIGGKRQGGGERFLCLACETLVCGDWGKKHLADHARVLTAKLEAGNLGPKLAGGGPDKAADPRFGELKRTCRDLLKPFYDGGDDDDDDDDDDDGLDLDGAAAAAVALASDEERKLWTCLAWETVVSECQQTLGVPSTIKARCSRARVLHGSAAVLGETDCKWLCKTWQEVKGGAKLKSDVKVAVTSSLHRASGRLNRNDGNELAVIRHVCQAIADFDQIKTRREVQDAHYSLYNCEPGERLGKGAGAQGPRKRPRAGEPARASGDV
eukprot:COSAG06_NODE_66_length_26393_cov_6.455161_7_plen_447_part_00